MAAQRLPKHVLAHFTQGAREGLTAGEARQAWTAHRFLPHVLRGPVSPSIATSLLGTGFASPIGIAPTSLKSYADPGGDVSMARAAVAADTLLVVPSNTGNRFEDIASTGVTWWLQVYLTEDRELVRPVIESAVRHGARAVVLTVDTPVVGTKYGADPSLWAGVGERVNHTEASRDRSLPGAGHAKDLSLADISWLGDVAGCPVVLKGVLRPDDARVGIDNGADAIWVSNHGGRQLDRTLASADALPDVVGAVGSAGQVFVDGGLDNGLDTLAALGLGANAVFLGRLPLLALAAGGPDLVTAALLQLRRELTEAMALAGCATLADTLDLVKAAPPHPARGPRNRA